MANLWTSLIFSSRNVKKTENGEIGRAPVAAGQAANAFKAVAKYDNAVGRGAQTATSIFTKMSKDSKVLKYAGKVVDFASKNINPLICVSSGIKVATSDNKLETGILEAGALAGMFLGEGVMKRYQDKIFNETNVTKVINKAHNNKTIGKFAQKVLKTKYAGKYAELVKGIAFVAVSISSYSAGKKLADNLAGEVCANFGIKRLDQKA